MSSNFTQRYNSNHARREPIEIGGQPGRSHYSYGGDSVLTSTNAPLVPAFMDPFNADQPIPPQISSAGFMTQAVVTGSFQVIPEAVGSTTGSGVIVITPGVRQGKVDVFARVNNMLVYQRTIEIANSMADNAIRACSTSGAFSIEQNTISTTNVGLSGTIGGILCNGLFPDITTLTMSSLMRNNACSRDRLPQSRLSEGVVALFPCVFETFAMTMVQRTVEQPILDPLLYPIANQNVDLVSPTYMFDGSNPRVQCRATGGPGMAILAGNVNQVLTIGVFALASTTSVHLSGSATFRAVVVNYPNTTLCSLRINAVILGLDKRVKQTLTVAYASSPNNFGGALLPGQNALDICANWSEYTNPLDLTDGVGWVRYTAEIIATPGAFSFPVANLEYSINACQTRGTSEGETMPRYVLLYEGASTSTQIVVRGAINYVMVPSTQLQQVMKTHYSQADFAELNMLRLIYEYWERVGYRHIWVKTDYEKKLPALLALSTQVDTQHLRGEAGSFLNFLKNMARKIGPIVKEFLPAAEQLMSGNEAGAVMSAKGALQRLLKGSSTALSELSAPGLTMKQTGNIAKKRRDAEDFSAKRMKEESIPNNEEASSLATFELEGDTEYSAGKWNQNRGGGPSRKPAPSTFKGDNTPPPRRKQVPEKPRKPQKQQQFRPQTVIRMKPLPTAQSLDTSEQNNSSHHHQAEHGDRVISKTAQSVLVNQLRSLITTLRNIPKVAPLDATSQRIVPSLTDDKDLIADVAEDDVDFSASELGGRDTCITALFKGIANTIQSVLATQTQPLVDVIQSVQHLRHPPADRLMDVNLVEDADLHADVQRKDVSFSASKFTTEETCVTVLFPFVQRKHGHELPHGVSLASMTVWHDGSKSRYPQEMAHWPKIEGIERNSLESFCVSNSMHAAGEDVQQSDGHQLHPGQVNAIKTLTCTRGKLLFTNVTIADGALEIQGDSWTAAYIAACEMLNTKIETGRHGRYVHPVPITGSLEHWNDDIGLVADIPYKMLLCKKLGMKIALPRAYEPIMKITGLHAGGVIFVDTVADFFSKTQSCFSHEFGTVPEHSAPTIEQVFTMKDHKTLTSCSLRLVNGGLSKMSDAPTTEDVSSRAAAAPPGSEATVIAALSAEGSNAMEAHPELQPAAVDLMTAQAHQDAQAESDINTMDVVFDEPTFDEPADAEHAVMQKFHAVSVGKPPYVLSGAVDTTAYKAFTKENQDAVKWIGANVIGSALADEPSDFRTVKALILGEKALKAPPTSKETVLLTLLHQNIPEASSMQLAVKALLELYPQHTDDIENAMGGNIAGYIKRKPSAPKRKAHARDEEDAGSDTEEQTGEHDTTTTTTTTSKRVKIHTPASAQDVDKLEQVAASIPESATVFNTLNSKVVKLKELVAKHSDPEKDDESGAVMAQRLDASNAFIQQWTNHATKILPTFLQNTLGLTHQATADSMVMLGKVLLAYKENPQISSSAIPNSKLSEFLRNPDGAAVDLKRRCETRAEQNKEQNKNTEKSMIGAAKSPSEKMRAHAQIALRKSHFLEAFSTHQDFYTKAGSVIGAATSEYVVRHAEEFPQGSAGFTSQTTALLSRIPTQFNEQYKNDDNFWRAIVYFPQDVESYYRMITGDKSATFDLSSTDGKMTDETAIKTIGNLAIQTLYGGDSADKDLVDLESDYLDVYSAIVAVVRKYNRDIMKSSSNKVCTTWWKTYLEDAVKQVRTREEKKKGATNASKSRKAGVASLKTMNDQEIDELIKLKQARAEALTKAESPNIFGNLSKFSANFNKRDTNQSSIAEKQRAESIKNREAQLARLQKSLAHSRNAQAASK